MLLMTLCTPSLSWSTASKQLQQVIVKLVKESFGDTYYGKAMDCVKALREEAIRVSAREQEEGGRGGAGP